MQLYSGDSIISAALNPRWMAAMVAAAAAAIEAVASKPGRGRKLHCSFETRSTFNPKTIASTCFLTEVYELEGRGGGSAGRGYILGDGEEGKKKITKRRD